MIKHFCDLCGDEITPENECKGKNGRLEGKHTRNYNELLFEVIVGVNGVWNSGDVCRYCVIDAINRVDDRPRTA